MTHLQEYVNEIKTGNDLNLKFELMTVCCVKIINLDFQSKGKNLKYFQNWKEFSQILNE